MLGIAAELQANKLLDKIVLVYVSLALATPTPAGFGLIVLWDIVVANVVVARLVLGPPGRLRPVYVEVPLELEQPLAIALLGSIITMTPGTVSSDLSDDRRRLLVHVLDTGDPQALVANIKARYERPLKEIFS